MLRKVVVLMSELMLPMESVSMWSLVDLGGTEDGKPAKTASGEGYGGIADEEVEILDMEELDL